MNAIATWVALSSGTKAAKETTGVEFAKGEAPSAIPSALLDLLKGIGGLAGNIADLIGLAL